MIHAIIHANILLPQGFLADHCLIFSGKKIIGILPYKDFDHNRVDHIYDTQGLMLLPGLIDLQVNGGGGALFNAAPSVETIRRIGEAHRAFGTTAFLPTLISDDTDVMDAAIAAADKAIAQGVPGVLGIHLEGPHLNPAKKGVHDDGKFTQIGAAELARLTRLKTGKTLITLAPEKTSPEIIGKLCAAGAIISAGHSNASYDEARAAMDAGLTGVTHLYNAMTPLQSRAPGLIAAALEDERAFCGLIADGHHVHPAMIRLALRAKSDGQIFLVTDAMPSVGAIDKDFRLYGQKITVREGRCVTEDGTLAGSDLDMLQAVKNARDMVGVSLKKAVDMASLMPAKFLGIDHEYGSLEPGKRADMILVDNDLSLVQSWISGTPWTPSPDQ